MVIINSCNELPVKSLTSYLTFLKVSSIWLHETGQAIYQCKTGKNVAKVSKITVDRKIEVALNITTVLL